MAREERKEELSEEEHTYDDVRDTQMAINAEKMKSLGIPILSSDLSSLTKPAHVEKPKKKVMKNFLMFFVCILFLYAEFCVVICREL
jgi:hypothetical protein